MYPKLMLNIFQNRPPTIYFSALKDSLKIYDEGLQNARVIDPYENKTNKIRIYKFKIFYYSSNDIIPKLVSVNL